MGVANTSTCFKVFLVAPETVSRLTFAIGGDQLHIKA
jgi:hypothetical protein